MDPALAAVVITAIAGFSAPVTAAILKFVPRKGRIAMEMNMEQKPEMQKLQEDVAVIKNDQKWMQKELTRLEMMVSKLLQRQGIPLEPPIVRGAND